MRRLGWLLLVAILAYPALLALRVAASAWQVADLAAINPAETSIHYRDLPPTTQSAVIAIYDPTVLTREPRSLGRTYSALIWADRSLLGSPFKVARARVDGDIGDEIAEVLLAPPQHSNEYFLDRTVLAFIIEQRLTREEQIDVLLNLGEFGGGSPGIERAARKLFDKSLVNLSVSETATLAGVRMAPGRTPGTPPAVRTRRDYVLQRMKAAGALSDPDYNEALRAPTAVISGG